jgi:penicillin-binding protein 1A
MNTFQENPDLTGITQEQDSKQPLNPSPFKKYIWILWSIFLIPLIGALIIFTLISYGKLGYMPSFEELENPKTNLATEVISEDGKLLGTFYRENRTKAEFNELSPNLTQALLATEDIRFYEHSGIDIRSIGRAVSGVFKGGSKGGGSTITQQLAKMLFPREKLNFIELIFRKLREWVIAVKLERSYTKDEIIAMYFNKMDFINQAVGVKSAAAIYFSTSPDSIKIEEAAVLVGMLKNPSLFNPIRRPDTTLHRRNVVLSQMLKYEFLEESQFDSLKALPLNLKYNKVDHKEGIATYFREMLRTSMTRTKPEKDEYWSYQEYQDDSVRWESDPLFGWCYKNLKGDSIPYDIYSDGLKIYTTINSRMQLYAEQSVSEHIAGYLQDEIYKDLRAKRYPPFSNDLSKEEIDNIIKSEINQSERKRALALAGASAKEILADFKNAAPMTVFDWKSGEKDTMMTPLDSIYYYLHYLNTGFMSMNPHNGFVKAYVGGINYKHFKFDHVVQAKRQVGSTIKPFLYSIAMREGYSPCYEVPCIPTTFTLWDGSNWTPKNASKSKMDGKMVTLKWGLAQSNNYISAWLMKQFSPEPFVDIMHKAGIRSFIDPVPSMILGTSEMTLYEMVGAYSVYANKGIYTQPIFVTRIEDKYGNVIAEFKPYYQEVMSEETAYLMLNLLQGVINEGSGIRLRFKYKLTAEMGGKTGTTSNQSDGWFMGITPDLVSGVWVGGKLRSIHFVGLSEGQGANMALPIYGLFMQKVYGDPQTGVTADPFPRPERPFSFDLDCNKLNQRNDYEFLDSQQNDFFN